MNTHDCISMKWLVNNSEDERYIVVFDSQDEDNKIYGIMKIDTSGLEAKHKHEPEILFRFFNDISQIDLSIREVSKSEYETYQAFDLFPVLTPYDRGYVPFKADMSSFDLGIDFHTPARVIYKVRFRDY